MVIRFDTRRFKQAFIALTLGAGLALHGALAAQVLATVGGQEITSEQLDSTIASSPVAVQFPSMDEKEQARIRGDMLVRLVNAEILYQEALTKGLDKTADFAREVNNFRTGLLSQRYQYALRDSIEVSESVEKTLQQRFKGDGDALAAARSLYVSPRYRELKQERLKGLAQRYHLKTHLDRLNDSPGPETVIAEGDGFVVHYQDLTGHGSPETPVEEHTRLEELTELLLMARGAMDEGIDIQQQMANYKRRLLGQLLLNQKEREWIPDRQVLLDYFQKYPELGYVPAIREIGQIVVGSRKQAEALQRRIQNGESLYLLAEQYSIDPYGKAHSGDMGWLKEGTGMPQIEAALKGLKDGEVSAVIETPKGFHLVMIRRRQPAEHKPFSAVEDRVRQAYLQERLAPYIQELVARHPVEWTMPDHEPVGAMETQRP
jgi:peptidyl-prolyl cis-trans isomerase C